MYLELCKLNALFKVINTLHRFQVLKQAYCAERVTDDVFCIRKGEVIEGAYLGERV